MRNHLKVVLLSLIAASGASLLTGCGTTTDLSSAGTSYPNNGKIGLIEIGDETEGYSLAHIDGINAAAQKLGVSDRLVWKKKVAEDSGCKTAIDDLVSSECGLVVSNSYGHQDFMCDAASDYSDVKFVAMTGDYAQISGQPNFKNAFVSIYQARYVSGVVAGMKLKSLIESNALDASFNKNADGKWKIGYVGAYKYAEVISGYTSFFLGVKSIVSDVAMEVKFTNSWFDVDAEGSAADALVKDGCVIIGQHADSTGAPAKIESLLNSARTSDKKYICYSVGFNIDMTTVAPHAALTSALNNWEVYYEDLFKAFLNNEAIVDDWCKGYEENAVSISPLNSEAVAVGTQDAVDAAVAKIKDGSLQIFDTSTFDVGGSPVSTYTVDLSHYDFSGSTPKIIYQGNQVEAIKTVGGTSYFAESTYRSAPYFDIKIDNIIWLD